MYEGVIKYRNKWRQRRKCAHQAGGIVAYAGAQMKQAKYIRRRNIISAASENKRQITWLGSKNVGIHGGVTMKP